MLHGRTTTVVLLALGCLALGSIIAAQPSVLGRVRVWGDALHFGLPFGTFFGMVALASAWTAYGFPSPWVRIGQSLLLCGVSVAGMVVNGAISGAPVDQLAAMAHVMAIGAAGQYLLIAALLWPLVASRGFRLRHLQQLSAEERIARQQFAVRDLLIVMAVTALLLAALRWIVTEPSWAAPQQSIRRDLLFLGFMAACNAFVTNPLLVAPLLRRFALTSTTATIAFAIFVTA